METLYRTKAISVGGRDGGKVWIENSPLVFEMVLPAETGGTGKTGTNPEQLFAAAYAACFESALRHIAKIMRLELKAVSVAVEISIKKDEKGSHSLSADITASVKGIEQTAADKLVQEAHKLCPYSKATRGNIEVSVSAVIE